MKEIRCFACKYPLIKETAAGESDRWGFGPYIDLSSFVLEGLTIRLYYSGREDQKAGIVCPMCGRVTWINTENLDKKVPFGWPEKPFPYPSREKAEKAVREGEEMLRALGEQRRRASPDDNVGKIVLY